MSLTATADELVKPPGLHILADNLAELALENIQGICHVVDMVADAEVTIFSKGAGVVLTDVDLVVQSKGVVDHALTGGAAGLTVFVYGSVFKKIDAVAFQNHAGTGRTTVLREAGTALSTVAHADNAVGGDLLDELCKVNLGLGCAAVPGTVEIKYMRALVVIQEGSDVGAVVECRRYGGSVSAAPARHSEVWPAVENRFAVGRRETEDAQVMQAIRYIKTHLHMKITISQAGRESGLSQAQFIRRFKAFTGMTPQDYAASLKLQKAKSLLRDSDVPIQKVAELCGFENGYYFSNYFKKKTGMSPSGYRRTAL